MEEKLKPIFTQTNPNKRCMYCKGREVKDIFADGKTENNLEELNNGLYRCKDVNECEQNLMAEHTGFEVDGGKGHPLTFRIVKNGETLLEITNKQNDI